MERRGFLKGATGLVGASLVGSKLTSSAAADDAQVAAVPSPPQGMAGVRGGAKDDEAFWTQIRQQFRLSYKRIYLNTAGLGPSPRHVIRAVSEMSEELEDLCETGHSHALWTLAKERAGHIFGCEPEEIAYTRNTTDGVNIVCNGLPLKAGDEVITTTHEHVGNTISWLARARRDGIRMRVFEPSTTSAGETLDRFASLINDRTRVISISHITTATGQVLPMAEIGKLAKEHGLFYFVDGAQSVGHIPLDMKAIGCHAYATSGHKWLLGPKGTGLLYVRRDALDEIEAKWVGAYSGAGDFDMATGAFGFADTAQRYEFGTVPVSLFHGLSEAMGFLLDLGMDRVWARSHYLGQRLIKGLQRAGADVVSPLDSSENSGIIVFRVNGMTRPQLQSYLAKDYKIRTRGIYEGGLEAVRVSPHIYSTGADVDRVIEAVDALNL